MRANPTRSLVTLASVVALVIVSCSGSGDADSGVASLETEGVTTPAADDGGGDQADLEQALLDFAACMREHGVDMEDPTVDADGNIQFGSSRGGGPNGGGDSGDAVDREMMIEARDACAEYLEGLTLGFRGGGGPEEADLQDRIYEYAQCMRDNGVEMDDPDFSGFGPGGEGDGEPGGGPFGDLDRGDPDFQAAQEACGDILGGFGPGGGGRLVGPPPGTGGNGD